MMATDKVKRLQRELSFKYKIRARFQQTCIALLEHQVTELEQQVAELQKYIDAIPEKYRI